MKPCSSRRFTIISRSLTRLASAVSPSRMGSRSAPASNPSPAPDAATLDQEYDPVASCDAVAEICAKVLHYDHDKVLIDLLQKGLIQAVRNKDTLELGYLPTEQGIRMVEENREMLQRIFNHDI